MPEIVRKNPVNDPTQKPVKTHSKFEPSYSQYAGHQFGVYTPHFVMAGVADDDISMRVSADADTYTLKAPLMQPLKRNMDYFQLPLRALLPSGAELLITNPLRGDDVVAANVNATMTPSDAYQLMVSIISPLNQTFSNIAGSLAGLLRCYQMYSLVMSKGALPKHLGISFFSDSYVTVSLPVGTVTMNYKVDIEKVFTALFTEIETFMAQNGGQLDVTFYDYYFTQNSGNIPISVAYNGVHAYIGPDLQTDISGNSSGYYFSTFREFIQWFMECNMRVDSVSVSSLGGDAGSSLLPDSYGSGNTLLLAGAKLIYGDTVTTANMSYSRIPENVNLLRLVAYQKACAEFYTNDKIDAVYSAKLWEDNQLAIARYMCAMNGGNTNYLVNGVSVEYDACAGAFISTACQNLSLNQGISSSYAICWIYLHNLFSFNRSLKYEDYFVGAKSQPLAVGDVTVGVDTSTNTVDIIDVTKRIQVQRFLNQVNRVGRKFSDYVKGILGDKPMKDVHEPIFLGHVVDTIGAEETENTGADQFTKQNSVTSKFRNNSSRYGFDVHIGEPSILIGLTSYDIPRAYTFVNDREIYHIDRYEAFNPFMQFVGDQEIFRSELKPFVNTSQIFGYTMRYMEYKQRVDRAVGPFALGVLPGYAKVITPYEVPDTINSSFLRSHVRDINEFYLSLTGYTPADLFHFIVRLDISVTANRPMAFAPSIL